MWAVQRPVVTQFLICSWQSGIFKLGLKLAAHILLWHERCRPRKGKGSWATSKRACEETRMLQNNWRAFESVSSQSLAFPSSLSSTSSVLFFPRTNECTNKMNGKICFFVSIQVKSCFMRVFLRSVKCWDKLLIVGDSCNLQNGCTWLCIVSMTTTTRQQTTNQLLCHANGTEISVRFLKPCNAHVSCP